MFVWVELYYVWKGQDMHADEHDESLEAAIENEERFTLTRIFWN